MNRRNIEKVTQFQTSDGAVFATLQEASTHQFVLDVAIMLAGDTDINLPSASPFDIVAWFARYFELTPKDET